MCGLEDTHMFRTALVTVVCVGMVGLVGCGSSGGDNNNTMQTQPDMAVPGPDLAPYDPGPYPAGPYGVQEGDTVYNLSSQGYMLSRDQTDATQLEYKALSIDVIRQNPKCKCLMLSLSATWCGPCNAEQPELIKAVEEDESFCAFNVLVNGLDQRLPATKDDVTDWNARHGQNYPIVRDNVSTHAHLPNPDKLPTNVVINPKTMKILLIEAGLGPNTIADAKELCASDN